MLKLLLSYGADVNHSLSDGTLPLHIALAIGKCKWVSEHFFEDLMLKYVHFSDDDKMFEFLIEVWMKWNDIAIKQHYNHYVFIHALKYLITIYCTQRHFNKHTNGKIKIIVFRNKLILIHFWRFEFLINL